MSAATQAGPRILTLDIVRGVAVMGILAMNIVAFAMPFEAYMNPMAYGAEGIADLVSWYFSFIFVEGKMRGLFSFLFGASMLLVIEQAAASGESPAGIHFRRMFWLLLFGLIHFYFIWFGDILALYAPIGMIAWFFHGKSARALVLWGIALVLVQFLIFAASSFGFHAASAAAAAPSASQEAIRAWAEMKGQFAAPSQKELAGILSTYGGGYGGIFAHRFANHGTMPLISLFFFGAETLGYMLFGMAALKSGFLTGAWSGPAYRRAAAVGFGIGVPAYAVLGWIVWSSGFAVVTIFDVSMTATTLVRPAMIVATAALVIILTRRGGALVARIAATGRAAFTNYLGTSIVMTTLFYGYGFDLFGKLSRAELWLVVAATWGLMLLWSKPWLDRYRYGPFEWLWRTLARWEVQPLRKPAVA
jgi:uncharacterized protein